MAYGEEAGLRSAAAKAQSLIDEFDNQEAAQLLTKLQAALAERAKTGAVAAAAPLLARAKDLEKSGMKLLAGATYRDIVQRFAGTDAADEAGKALAAMGQ